VISVVRVHPSSPETASRMKSMPHNRAPEVRLPPERVAYWYFRLNGFLQIENFVLHPAGGGSQRTDADLLAVRFPDRKELLFDHAEPMQDDITGLSLAGSDRRSDCRDQD
jgi:hypothetical protein